jgi:uncharacterized coiled-coil DUF342 family protein
MNLLELNAKKAELIKLLKKAPCQYSTEELKERALLAIEEMKQGKGISHEEMKNRYKPQRGRFLKGTKKEG